VDIEFIVSLVFSLLVIIIVGGSILLFPITRRLGLLLERRLETEALPGDELRQLHGPGPEPPGPTGLHGEAAGARLRRSASAQTGVAR
jgi:hypothetical protein